jgi:hypothetical protein
MHDLTKNVLQSDMECYLLTSRARCSCGVSIISCTQSSRVRIFSSRHGGSNIFDLSRRIPPRVWQWFIIPIRLCCVLEPRRLRISSISCAVFTSWDQTDTTTISEEVEQPSWLYSSLITFSISKKKFRFEVFMMLNIKIVVSWEMWFVFSLICFIALFLLSMFTCNMI